MGQYANDLRNLMIERLKRFPTDLQMSVGNASYTKQDMLKSVESGNELGKQIMDIQLKYLQDLASGKIYLDE